MEAVFLKLLNMSITASWLVAAVVLLRLVLKKAPKIISLILWALVGIRLILPISFESVFSLVPSAQTFPSDIVTSPEPIIDSGIPMFNNNVNPIISQTFAPNASDSVNPMQVITFVAAIVWISGVTAMLLYGLVSYVRLKLKVREAVKLQGNIMLCDNIASPFILGIIRPKIYVPSSVSEQDLPYVLAHENAHLKRRDHFWKPLGFLLLSVYWFNPVLWVAYVLLCRDIELACDEKVIKELGIEAKKPYSTALVNCSVSHKTITVCPLAFGEVGVKKRVKTVLNYKVPAFWIIIVALIICAVVAVCFLTNPLSDTDTTTTNPPDTTSTVSPYGEFKLVGSTMLWTGAYDTPYIDSISCDIDNDGITEKVCLYTGPTSGVSSYYLVVWNNKTLEQVKMYSPLQGTWEFDRFADGVLYINQTRLVDYATDKKEVTTLTLSFKDGNLVVEGGEALGGFALNGDYIASIASHTFDIDGDGQKEYCKIEPILEYYPNTLFRFLVFQNESDLVPKYYEIYNFHSMYSLAFAENADGEIVLFGMKGGAPSTIKTVDISVEKYDKDTGVAYKDGIIVLSEKGKDLDSYPVRPEDVEYKPYTYYFDYRNRVYADVDGDGKEETLTLGYIQLAMASDNWEFLPVLEWTLCITDGNTEKYIPLGVSDLMTFTQDGDRVYIEKTMGDSTNTFGEIVLKDGKYYIMDGETPVTDEEYTYVTVH